MQWARAGHAPRAVRCDRSLGRLMQLPPSPASPRRRGGMLARSEGRRVFIGQRDEGVRGVAAPEVLSGATVAVIRARAGTEEREG
jgi:hypothetical protein